MTTATIQASPAATTLQVKPLSPTDERMWRSFLKTKPTAAMLCYTLTWRDIVADVTKAEPLYSICMDGEQMVGVMPAFLKEAPSGNVLNALPFFGFHGEPLVADQRPEARQLLLDNFDRLARKHNCRSATVVTNPLIEQSQSNPVLDDGVLSGERIGQIAHLPLIQSTGDKLLEQFEGRTRTAIRKAIKEGVQCRVEDSPESLAKVRALHERNAADLGIAAKPAVFFEAVSRRMRIGVGYDVLTATLNGREIAHLLVFDCGLVAEYFMPCVDADYRSVQPLSLLIFEGMKRAAERGCVYWNFGGTAPHLDGVYKFKKSWGAKDFRYYHETRVYDQSLFRENPKRLLLEYEHFYVLPFAALEQK